MHENMSKLSSYNSAKPKNATTKLIKNKLTQNSTLDKFNFEPGQFLTETSFSPIRGNRPQSIDPRLSIRKTIKYEQTQNRKASQDSRKSSNSLRPTHSGAAIARVTKAKMLKIERLKQLYVQK